ncbi:MAG: DNA topoisomerase [Lachnospiraceae bacterium]|nr:DNA topoisomerase [Lachnospiraceae bacterium]
MAEQIVTSEYSDLMQKSYIDYSMSVICQRAVPDVRDGLKPVQRRVLYAMDQLGLNYDKPHRKSARIVGDTMGKYHPHGDSSIYEALVVLEQDFKKGMALIDGHGNFGSIEGDGAAAMRYTEAKLKKFTQQVYLADLDKDVVDFVPNFDETEKEPEVLPVRIPNVLVNGAEGIAVGMTTSIPTHNLSEVIDAVIAYMDNQEITTEGLMEYVKGPDFPTGGLVVNKSELLNIYENGTGKIKLRGKVEFEKGTGRSDRDKLVITEIPYTMVGANIGKFISDVVELIESKKTQDIADISNQSSKEGIRIVLELKKNADVQKLENMLYKKTRLEDTFGVNMLTIVEKKPEILGLKGIIKHNVDFQFEIQTRKYTTLLGKELEQKEIKEGLIRACDMIDLIIEILRGSTSLKDAKNCLINGVTDNIKFKHKESELYASNLNFTEKQAQAILDLRLYKLIGLEILALQKEYEAILERIAEYEEILSNKKAMAKVIKKELLKIKKDYAVPRKTLIINGKEAVYEENPIVEQEVVFVMDRFGYAKTIDTSLYEKNQETVDSENKYIFRCMNTDKVYIFTDTGSMHTIKIIDVPFVKVKDKGTPVDNLGNYDSKGENIVFICSSDMVRDRKLLFTTSQGMMKLVSGNEFDVSKRTVMATKLGEGDSLVSVLVTGVSDSNNIIDSEDMNGSVMLSGGSDEEGEQLAFDFDDMMMSDEIMGEMPAESVSDEIVVLQTNDGIFLKFKLSEIPEKKKGAIGVIGIKLGADDYVSKVYVMDAGDNIVAECNGKSVSLRNLKTNKRGTKGKREKKI